MLDRTVRLVSVLMWALATAPAMAANAADEKQCTLAITESQKSLREILATKPRDRDKVLQQIAAQDKLIQDGRRKGLSECDIWAQVLAAAFRS